MKKLLNLFTLFLCMTTLVIGTISCESQEQKEARAEAKRKRQQKQELFKTIDGFRQYLKGKSFVYCEDFQYLWVKLTFSDSNTVIAYFAESDDRSWGKGEEYTYKTKEIKDEYGRIMVGRYNVSLNNCYFNYASFNFDADRISTHPRSRIFFQNVIYYEKMITLVQCDADFIPSQWKD